MKLKQFITLISIAVLPLAAGAATFIVPAAGTGPGANDSHWQSELTLHNTSAGTIAVGVKFHDAIGGQTADDVQLAPRSTVSIPDIVKSRFGRTSATGALEITVPDTVARKVVITSRTYNVSATGEFGQDIPAVDANDAATAGDVLVLQGPSSTANDRFNFGVYAVTDTAIRWDLVRADGTVAATKETTYTAGTQTQYNAGVQALFAADAQNNDAIQGAMTSGKAIAYGSAVNNASGDPTFVRGIRARADIRLNFAGVDLNENGTIDVADADHDGVLDQPLDVVTSLYPHYFRIVVAGFNGEAAKLEIVSSTGDAMLIDANTVVWAPGGNLKGTSGTLIVRATAGGISEILTIPANFR